MVFHLLKDLSMTFLSFKTKSPLLLLFMGLSLAVPSAFSQTLNIVGGQGQLVTPSQPTPQPFVVQLLGATGQPLAGATVTFTSLDSQGGYVPSDKQNVLTDGNGMASSSYVGASLVPGTQAYDTGSITASYNATSTVTFYVTTSNLSTSGGSVISVDFSSLTGGQSFTGSAGTVSATPIRIPVQSASSAGVASTNVPFVSLALVLSGDSTGSISCQEGPFVITNGQGFATCTPVYGKVGSGYFTVTIGGAFNSNVPIPFTVTVGPPALISINSGNNQSGLPGRQLPLPIVATVTDLGGNPISGVAMTFTASPSSGATFTSVRQVTDSAGKVSATVTLGNNPGAVQIIVTDAGGLIKNPAVFTETVNVNITGITKNSGDQQSAFVNSPFSTPLTVTVGNSTGGTLSGLPVTFAVTSGSATVSNPSTTTGANGQASTSVTAGATVGPIVITATSGAFSTTFNLSVIPPGPTSLSFTNGASGALNSISPGSIVTIYGNGLANNIQGVTSAFGVGPLPLQLVGATVQFGGIYAPIFDVGNISGSQFITVQVPYEVTPGSVNVTIALAGGGSTTVPVTVSAASPALFTYTGADNQLYLVAIKANGTVASPSNPANRGESVTIYMTGVPLNPGLSTNAFPAPGSAATAAGTLILGVANQGVPYTSVAYSPDLAAVESLTFIVPSSAGTGPVQISIGVITGSGASFFSQGATLNVQ
jgi:uncharacterized protein (TIGR03437 family)